jgi:hypothetical protein
VTDTDLPQQPTVIEWLAAAAAADVDTLTDAQLVEVDQLATQIQSAVMQVQVRRHVDAVMNAAGAVTVPPAPTTEPSNPDTTGGFDSAEPMTDVMPAVVQGDLA